MEHNIIMDLNEMGWESMDLIHHAQDRASDKDL
jgi:hypothetical protein